MSNNQMATKSPLHLLSKTPSELIELLENSALELEALSQDYDKVYSAAVFNTIKQQILYLRSIKDPNDYMKAVDNLSNKYADWAQKVGIDVK